MPATISSVLIWTGSVKGYQEAWDLGVLRIETGACPRGCKGRWMIRWGWYWRKCRGGIEILKFKIQRFRCKICGLTSSARPSFLSPRGRYALCDLGEILVWMVKRSSSVWKVLDDPKLESEVLEHGLCERTLQRLWALIQEIESWAAPLVSSLLAALDPGRDPQADIPSTAGTGERLFVLFEHLSIRIAALWPHHACDHPLCLGMGILERMGHRPWQAHPRRSSAGAPTREALDAVLGGGGAPTRSALKGPAP